MNNVLIPNLAKRGAERVARRYQHYKQLTPKKYTWATFSLYMVLCQLAYFGVTLWLSIQVTTPGWLIASCMNAVLFVPLYRRRYAARAFYAVLRAFYVRKGYIICVPQRLDVIWWEELRARKALFALTAADIFERLRSLTLTSRYWLSILDADCKCNTSCSHAMRLDQDVRTGVEARLREAVALEVDSVLQSAASPQQVHNASLRAILDADV